MKDLSHEIDDRHGDAGPAIGHGVHETPWPAVDVMLEPPASMAIFLSALLEAGRSNDIGVVSRSHREASEDAARVLKQAGVWSSRSQSDAPVPFDYAPALGQVEFTEHGLDDAKKQLHAHLVATVSVGVTLDRPALERALPLIRARYERSLLDGVTARLGLDTRKLRGQRELVGVPDSLIDSWEPGPCRVAAATPQLRQG